MSCQCQCCQPVDVVLLVSMSVLSASSCGPSGVGVSAVRPVVVVLLVSVSVLSASSCGPSGVCVSAVSQ